jgi:hypothetical protein
MELQLLAHTAQHRNHEHIDAPEQVTLRDAIFEPKLIEQTCLIADLPTHHRRLRDRLLPGISGITVRRRSQAFFDSIDPKQTFCGSAQEALLIQFERSLGTAKARAAGDASPRGSSLWHPRLAQAFNDPLALR